MSFGDSRLQSSIWRHLNFMDLKYFIASSVAVGFGTSPRPQNSQLNSSMTAVHVCSHMPSLAIGFSKQSTSLYLNVRCFWYLYLPPSVFFLTGYWRFFLFQQYPEVHT